jgi:DNA-binding response OmpR family regulator
LNKSEYNILIVEDSKFFNERIYDGMRRLGYNCNQSFSLKLLEEKIILYETHCIILDLHLPDGNSLDYISSIKHRIQDVKIIILTADKSSDSRDLFFKSGIIDYFIKTNDFKTTIKDMNCLIENLDTNKKETILVVDDSKIMVRNLQRVLSQRNYNILVAFSGEEALKIVYEEKNISLMILDITLPGISGEEVIVDIRENVSYDLPVLAFSDIRDAATVSKIIKVGANDFIHKPGVWEEFLLKVNFWISYQKKERSLKEEKLKLSNLNKTLEDRIQTAILENKEQQEILSNKSQLIAMGEMLANISHQWKQPLTVLSILLQKLYFKPVVTVEENEELVEESMVQINYLSTTIEDFRTFFISSTDVTDFNIVDTIKTALSIIGKTLESEQVNIDIRSHNSDFLINGKINTFSQVIINLLNNSKDALVSNKIKDKKVIIEYGVLENGKRYVTVEDNAGGIDNGILLKIFDPYFTTKFKTQGTGIGLYMSKNIIEKQMSGELSVSNIQNGAKFKIEL